jgi:flagellar hook-associated protein 1 FlgK
VLLDQLSSAVGAKATLNANGTASVRLPGADGTSKPLVSTGGDGTPPFQYAVLGATYAKNAAGDPAGPGDTPLSVKLGISGLGDLTTAPDMSAGLVPVTPGGSTANAEMQTINETVKSYRDKLDGVAQALAKTVNDVQANGYTLDGTSGATKPMFTTTSGDSTIANITAANITVALTGKDAWQQVAAADTQSTDSSGNLIGNVDGGNALAASLKGSDPAGPDTAYSSLVGDLGRASSSAQQQQATQSVITSSVNTLQTTASGVSFDEEVSNMLTYQMAFQASSRVLTTLDSMQDTLINRTGLVGR